MEQRRSLTMADRARKASFATLTNFFQLPNADSARDIDRLADFELQVGHDEAAERLSLAAAAMREAAA